MKNESICEAAMDRALTRELKRRIKDLQWSAKPGQFETGMSLYRGSLQRFLSALLINQSLIEEGLFDNDVYFDWLKIQYEKSYRYVNRVSINADDADDISPLRTFVSSFNSLQQYAGKYFLVVRPSIEVCEAAFSADVLRVMQEMADDFDSQLADLIKPNDEISPFLRAQYTDRIISELEIEDLISINQDLELHYLWADLRFDNLIRKINAAAPCFMPLFCLPGTPEAEPYVPIEKNDENAGFVYDRKLRRKFELMIDRVIPF